MDILSRRNNGGLWRRKRPLPSHGGPMTLPSGKRPLPGTDDVSPIAHRGCRSSQSPGIPTGGRVTITALTENKPGYLLYPHQGMTFEANRP